MAGIVCEYVEAHIYRGGTDLQVSDGDDTSAMTRFGIYSGRQLRYLFGERLDGYDGEHFFEVEAAGRCAFGGIGAPYPMAKLKYRNRGKPDFCAAVRHSGVPKKLADRVRASLGGDDHA